MAHAISVYGAILPRILLSSTGSTEPVANFIRPSKVTGPRPQQGMTQWDVLRDLPGAEVCGRVNLVELEIVKHHLGFNSVVPCRVDRLEALVAQQH
jgi:hypothetical protein